MATALTPNARWDRADTGLAFPLTWTCWVRPDELPADFAGLFYTGGVDNNQFLAVFIHQATSRISVWDDSFTLRAETDIVALGEWIFLAVTASVGGDISLFWRSEAGTVLSSDVGTFAGSAVADDFLYLASNRHAPDFAHTFEGAFAHARVFDTELTSVQVMDESMSPTAVGDVGANGGDWPLHTPAGTDQSGNGNDLFLDQGTGAASITEGPTLDPFPLPLPSEFEPPEMVIELRLGGQWVDVTDRRQSQSISITRGEANETSKAQPATVSFELDNLDGALTPDNPLSPWWPHVRRGVPCRIRMPEHEQPGRSVLNLQAGDDAASANDPDLDITGDIDIRWWGSGVVGPQLTALVSKLAPAIDERAWVLWVSNFVPSFTWQTSGGAGPAVSPGVALPQQPVDYALRVTVDMTGGVGTFYTGPTIEGPWTQLGEQSSFTSPSDIRSTSSPVLVGSIDPDAANSALPFVGQMFAFELRDGIDGTVVANPDFRAQPPGTTAFTDTAGMDWTITGGWFSEPYRFMGEVSEWSPTWPYGDQSSATHPGEARVAVTAAGVLRRLTQGAKPLHSTLHRFITSPALEGRVVAYWPMEDGGDSDTIASPIAGVSPMTFGGDLSLASDDTIAASAPLPSVSSGQGAGWNAVVPPHTVDQWWRYDMFIVAPTLDPSNPGTLLAQIRSTGSVVLWRIWLSEGTFRVQGWIGDDSGPFTFEHAGGFSDHAFFANGGRVGLRVFPTASGVSYSFLFVQLGGSAVGWTEAVPFTSDVGRATQIGTIFGGPPDGIAMGHVAITTRTFTTWLSTNPGGFSGGPDTAFVGETAPDRIKRLCAEEQIPAAVTGGSNVRMGPQRQLALVDLLTEAAEADMGILSERLDTAGLAYRSRRALYDQDPQLELDAARGGIGDITHPLEPTFDDQRIRNDIEAKRTGGSTDRAVDEESVAAEGRYDAEVEVNVSADAALGSQAAWRLHLGTWPGMRYPAVSTELSIAPHLVDDWIAARLGDRVTIRNLPPQHPGTVDLLTQGTTETISPTRWTVTAACQPGGPWRVGVLDETASEPDASMRRLDATASVLVDAVDDSDTALSVGQVRSWLLLPGGSNDRAITADDASLHITGDIDVRIDARLDPWLPGPGDNFELAGRYTLPDERTWLLFLSADGRVRFRWSPDGEAGNEEERASTVELPASATRLALRVALDVDNGIGGHTLTFYTGPTIGGPWTQLGDAVTQAGATSVHAGDSPLAVGKPPTSGFLNMTGRVFAFELRDGINGAVVANPDFTSVPAGVAAFTDTAGLDWTLANGAEIPEVLAPWVNSTDHADQFPFDILVDGERMTVLAIGGDASPQTFAVARAINDIRKAHPAGSVVVVADPLRVAL